MNHRKSISVANNYLMIRNTLTSIVLLSFSILQLYGQSEGVFMNNDTVKSINQYKNGYRVGYWEFLNENGQLIRKGRFNQYEIEIGEWENGSFTLIMVR